MSDDDALFGDAEETASAATADSAATAAAVGAVAEKRAAKKRRPVCTHCFTGIVYRRYIPYIRRRCR